MAGGGNFIHRVISYLANELIVNGLANRPFGDARRLFDKTKFDKCPRFQRFAVRTSKKMDELSDIAAQKKKELAEQVKDASKNLGSFKNH